MADLIFSQQPAADGNLLFGDTGTAAPGNTAVVTGAFPALTFAATAAYASNTQRPMVRSAGAPWQRGESCPSGGREWGQVARKTPSGAATTWEDAARLVGAVFAPTPYRLLRTRIAARAGHQDALRVQAGDRRIVGQDGLHDRYLSRSAGHQDAIALRHARASLFQDCLRGARYGPGSRFQDARRTSRPVTTGQGKGLPSLTGRQARHQDARRPPAGIYVRPPIPPGSPCYTPSGALLFADGRAINGNLVFICERHDEPPSTVVVPIRGVYMVVNEVSLRRVQGNVEIPTFSMSLKIDFASWAWGFDASVPGTALADLEPSGAGDPVELEAIINGTPYRVFAESLSRERVFGQASVRVSGRGKSAVLGAPFAPARSFGNVAQRTAQQLMNDVLTINGVPLGWTVNWGLTDWLVPAGVFAHQGTYSSALLAIAGAAGAYIRPHGSLMQLDVLHKYPMAPWEWPSSMTPDYELPSALTTREAIEWVEKPRYNRVFVSGEGQGVLGQVTRAGTDGATLAPMVTDALITSAAAARQRGLAVLGDTGRVANVTLRLPVLDETGIIVPGNSVRYVDGGDTRLGIVRATQVDVGMPEVWQTLSVETHP